MIIGGKTQYHLYPFYHKILFSDYISNDFSLYGNPIQIDKHTFSGRGHKAPDRI